MAPDSQIRKIFSFLFGFTLLFTTVSAAELNLNDDTVWLNRDNQSHIEGNITTENEEQFELVIGPEEKVITSENGSFTTSDFYEADLSPTSQTSLKLKSGGDVIEGEEANIDLKQFNVEIESEGTGFVGSKIGRLEYTEPVEAVLSIQGGQSSIDKEDINVDNFAFTSPELNIQEATDVDAVQKDSVKVLATLYPQVVQDTSTQEEKINLRTTYSFEGKSFTFDNRFSPHIYQMRGVPVGERPPNLLDYSNINDLAYDVNIFEEGNDVNPTLYREDFELHIIESTNVNPIEVCQDDPDEQRWESTAIEGAEGDYRLSLASIPQLEDIRTYTFVTCLDPKDDRSIGKGTVIDSIRVRNGLKLDGRVVDSENRGVRMEMNLDREGTVIPVNTAQDGTYYKEIDSSGPDSSYSVTMNFFDRGMSSSDAEVTASGVDFAEKDGENLAGDSESIKFQYWDNPPVEQKAIKPINMMAVKFAYPMADNGHEARMKFDPTDVNTDNLKVYECNDWNFEGRTCLGDWEMVDDFTINYQGWRANFPIDNPYVAEDTDDGDQNILMNAYIVGTSADLVLNGGLTVSGPQGGTVATGSEIRVEGNINSENENPVEGADVEVSFYQGDNEVSSLDEVQTDITGRFVAKGSAPDDPGNYSIKITADEDNYNKLEKKFDNRFETVIEEGIQVSADSTLEVNPGEDSSSEITVQNTGQTDMEDVTLSFDGMDSQYFSVSDASFDEIPAGEEVSTELTVSLSSDYCDGGCGDWPSLEISATATNPDGEEFEAETDTLQIQISRSDTGDEESDPQDQQETSETDDLSNNSESGFTESVSDLENATGEFLASQSSLNLALGLIMVFMMVLAGAVKKQDGGNGSRQSSRGSRDGRGGRPRVQKPNVGGSTVKQVDPEEEDPDEIDNVVEQIESNDEDVDSQIDAIAGSFEAEQDEHTKVVEVDDRKTQGPETGEETFVCEETGEEFDTKAALKLHRQINGLDN